MRYSKFLRVPLSSVDQQSQEIGDRAAKLALKLIGSNGGGKPGAILLASHLVARDSSARGSKMQRQKT